MRFILGEPLEQFMSRAMIRILDARRKNYLAVWRTKLEARAIGPSKDAAWCGCADPVQHTVGLCVQPAECNMERCLRCDEYASWCGHTTDEHNEYKG